MKSKNNKKLEAINAKIADLQKIKNQLETDFENDMSQEITKILLKKNAFNINKNILLKKIESLIG